MKTNTLRNIVVGLWIIFIIWAVISLFLSKDKVAQEVWEIQNNERVTIWYSALRISLPVFVAQEQWYFTEAWLDVELERYDTAQPLMGALVWGNIDMAWYTALPITYNMMLRSETDLLFLSAMIEDQDHRISYLIVPDDAPENFSIQDLQWKKIGILPTVAYKAWIEQILLANNLNPQEDVELVQIAPALSPSALETWQVDALFTNDPAATTVIEQWIWRLLSDEVLVPSILWEPFVFGSFNIREDYANDNPIIVKKVNDALDQAITFINENPQQSKLLMTSYLQESQQPYVSSYPDARYLPSNEVSDELFQTIATQYVDIGIIQESIDLTGLTL